MRRRISRLTSQRGAALLLVLWVVALLTAMAATLLLLIDRSSKSAQHMLMRAQAQALADSAFDHTLWLLTAPDPQQHPPLDGLPHAVDVLGGQAQVSITDEAGRVDLNTASPELLQALLQLAGADTLQAEALMHAIVAWRVPKAGGLLDVSDLLRLKGMTPAIYGSLQTSVTVFTRAPTADLRYASALVRQALFQLGKGNAQSASLASISPTDAGSLAGRVLRIAVNVSDAGGDVLAETEVVRLTGDMHQAFWVLKREHGGRQVLQ